MNRLAFLLAFSPIVLGTAPGRAEELPRLGSEFQINTKATGRQSSPAVVGDRFGDVVVVWNSEDAAGAKQVFGQRYDVAGSRQGGELQISSSPGISSRTQIAATPDGGFVAVWVGQGVRLRLLGPSGAAKSSEIQVSSPGFTSVAADVAVNGRGEIMVLWTTGGTNGLVFTRRYDPHGQPLEDQLPLVLNRDLSLASVGLAAAPDGGFLAVWSENVSFSTTELRMRRFDDGSQAWGDTLRVSTAAGLVYNYDPQPVFRADGSFVVVWTRLPAVFAPNFNIPEVFARSFDPSGAPPGFEVKLFDESYSPAAVALDRQGNVLVLVHAGGDSIFATLFDRAWRPLTGRIKLHDEQLSSKFEPAVAADATGNFFAVWKLYLPGIALPGTPGSDGDHLGIFGQRLGDPRCAPGSEVLCLGPAGRFEAQVSWKNPFNGETGTGRSRPLSTDTGALWFFGPDNLDLMVKMLDARAVNGHFWFYLGSLSNVEYTVTVTDTATGSEKTYHNAPRQLASRADVEAFEDVAPVTSLAQELAAPVSKLSPAICPVSAQSLSLAEGRFKVEVDFVDPRAGVLGCANAIPLTADTGAFWFFGESNIELMIKILDGRAVNGHFWVFFGALSDVEYTITVTDTATGEVRTYVNAHGQLASRADIEAFPVGN